MFPLQIVDIFTDKVSPGGCFPTDGIVDGALLYATTRVAGFVDGLRQMHLLYVPTRYWMYNISSE